MRTQHKHELTASVCCYLSLWMREMTAHGKAIIASLIHKAGHEKWFALQPIISRTTPLWPRLTVCVFLGSWEKWLGETISLQLIRMNRMNNWICKKRDREEQWGGAGEGTSSQDMHAGNWAREPRSRPTSRGHCKGRAEAQVSSYFPIAHHVALISSQVTYRYFPIERHTAAPCRDVVWLTV